MVEVGGEEGEGGVVEEDLEEGEEEEEVMEDGEGVEDMEEEAMVDEEGVEALAGVAGEEVSLLKCVSGM